MFVLFVEQALGDGCGDNKTSGSEPLPKRSQRRDDLPQCTMATEEYKFHRLSWRVNLIGFSCSAALAFIVLVHRLRRNLSPRALKRLKVAISPGTEASQDAPSSPLHIQARQVVSNVQRVIAQEKQKGPRRSFLQDAGVVLLALDLLASLMRMWLLLLDPQWPPPHHPHHALLTGLAVQTCYLQALWLLFTHYIIVACIRRKQTVVTGPLLKPLAAVLVTWLVLGMGPTFVARLANVYEVSCNAHTLVGCLGLNRPQDPSDLVNRALLVYALA